MRQFEGNDRGRIACTSGERASKARAGKSLLSKAQSAISGALLPFGLYVCSVILFAGTMGVSQGAPFAGLLIVPMAAVLFYAAKLLSRLLSDRLVESRWVAIALQLASLLAMLYVSYECMPNLRWDWGTLVRSAISCASDGAPTHDQLLYLTRYPHNRFWFEFLCSYFTLLLTVARGLGHEQLIAASALLGVMVVQGTLLAMRHIVVRAFGARKGFFVWVLLLCYPPLYYYAPIVYNDTPAMLVTALMVLCWQRIENAAVDGTGLRSETVACCALGVLCGVAAKLRVIVLIVPISMFVTELLRLSAPRETMRRLLLVVLAGAISIVPLGMYTARHVSPSDEERDRYEVPTAHYVMMSFDHGSYNADDVAYTYSFETYRERVDADMARLAERVEGRGLFGTAEFMLVRKPSIIWGNGTLNGDYYVSTLPRRPESTLMQVLSKDGRYHKYALPLFDAFHLLLIVGIALSFVNSMRDRRHHIDFCQLVVIFIYAFFAIWECNARYLVAFIPILAICSAAGWAGLPQLGCACREDLAYKPDSEGNRP